MALKKVFHYGDFRSFVIKSEFDGELFVAVYETELGGQLLIGDLALSTINPSLTVQERDDRIGDFVYEAVAKRGGTKGERLAMGFRTAEYVGAAIDALS